MELEINAPRKQLVAPLNSNRQAVAEGDPAQLHGSLIQDADGSARGGVLGEQVVIGVCFGHEMT